jgi:predicted nucleotidyltransferase
MVKDEIRGILQRFHENLVNGGFNPLQIYLFGSQAYGKPHPSSDIDVMVVLPEELDLRDRQYGRSQVIAYQTDPRIEAWFVSEKEFNELETPIISTVREKGELVKAA